MGERRKRMKKIEIKISVKSFIRLWGILILLGAFVIPSFAWASEWPTRQITVIVGVTPGGNADTSTRAIVNEMSKTLGVPIVVTNMPGGGGGIAAENVFRAPNDGYTWHSQGSAQRSFGVMGFHASAPKDWYCLPTTTYVCVISVRQDSSFKSFPDLVEAMKKDPGKIPYGASHPATAYRISMEIMKKATGLSGRFVPYPGSTATQAALLSGDVQFIMTGVGEQAELLRGNKVRALTAYSDNPQDLKGYGRIPAITDYLPQLKAHLPYQGWSSISMRADIPKPILRKINEAFLKAVQTKSVKDYCERFEVNMIGTAGDEAQQMYLKQAAIDSWLLYELGVAKKSPAEFNIPKP